MKKFLPFFILIAMAGFSFLISLPACDKLVTEENTVNNYETVTVMDSTCVAACHSDQNSVLDIAQEEFYNAGHASDSLVSATVNDITLYNTSVCGPICHTSQGYIAQSTAAISEPLPMTCKTCHDYHTTWDYTLRFDDPVALKGGGTFDVSNSNNCAMCHKSLTDPVTKIKNIFDANANDSIKVSDFWGPHGSNQADMFLGQGGYEYSGVDYSNLKHAVSFTGGCVKCHIAVTNGFALGGHSMNMTDNGTENIAACNVSGCHIASTSISAFDTYNNTTTLQGYFDAMDSLTSKLDSLGLLDTLGYIHQEGVAGALYNYRFLTGDRSNGIHNPKYSLRLATSSLEYIQNYIDSLNNPLP